MAQRKVIGIGSPVVDLIAEIEEDFLKVVGGEKGGMELVDSETILGLLEKLKSRPLKAPGGSAGNTTFALAQLGMAASFMGKLGADENARFYRDTFDQLGGDCTRFKSDNGRATACCISFVTPDSERTMRTDLGAAMGFCPEDVSVEDFKGFDHAHIEGYLLFNHELLMSVLSAAKEAGCTISLDLGSFEVVEASKQILPDILSRFVDIVFANEEEAEAFCGYEDPQVGLKSLGQFCEIVAVKVGAQGAWLKNAEETIHVPAMKVSRVLDTTGAGDYWAAGFLYGHLNGYSLADCGRLGALLGGNVVQNLGATLPVNVWGTIADEIKKTTSG